MAHVQWYPRYCLIQDSHKNLRKKVPWFFHDFSRPKSKFPDKKYQHLFLRPMYQFVESITDRHRCTLTHTDTHMIWSRPTDYSTDFTSNWTDSRSQKLHLLISLNWVTDFPINIWKMISISHFHTDFILTNIIIILFNVRESILMQFTQPANSSKMLLIIAVTILFSVF